MSSTRPDLRFSDAGDERLYYRKFAQLPPKDASTIRVMDHNNRDYFTVLDEDADMIADNIYKTRLVIKTSNAHRYVTISPQVFYNTVLRFCLIENHLKVEVYHSKTFELVTMATPGNLESIANEYGINLESADFLSPMVAAVKFTPAKKIGVGLVDLLNSSIQLCEFEDNDLFSNLETLLLQLGVKEIIVPSNYDPHEETGDAVKLFQVLDRIGNIVVTSVKSSLFNKEVEHDLARIVEGENIELVLASKGINAIDFPLSLACCSALLHYLELSSGEFSIDKYNLSDYMKLDTSTTKALNIFPASNNYTKPNVSSIFDLLNKCKSLAGSRLLSQWLKQPLTSVSDITDRHELVELLVNDTSLRVFLTQDWLPRVPDVKRLLKKIANGVKKSSGNENKKLDDVVRLYQLVIVVPELLSMLNDNPLILKYWTEPIQKAHKSLIKFQELVETTIDLSPLDSSDLLHNDFNIKPEFDESLVKTNNQLEATLSDIKQCQVDASDDLNLEVDKKLKLEKHQNHGWCFRVTRNDSNVLRNNSKYQQFQTVKAGTYFSTKELRTLALQYQKYSDEYNSKQRELIREILSISLTYLLVFMPFALTLAHIDVIVSFANLSVFAPTPYVRPIIHGLNDKESRTLKLKDARHPVLEVQDDINFIANDVAMSPGKQFSIITGPNMGGKSTYIRQVGVIALMNQIGCFVPAREGAELPVFDAILSRVGAGDAQLKGLSTFMIEMLETSSILATASANSLIIIDELGRGTSTYDGFGLAWAILEHIIKEKECFTLFATHFHELTQLADKYPLVQNLHVVAHVEQADDITLMYRVEPGVSDKSFGIHVAELVKFPAKIVNMAKRKADELGGDGKRSKCTPEEIQQGIEKLKGVLIKWREQCYDGSKCTTDPDTAISKLREMVQPINDDKYVHEIMSQL